MIPPTLPGGIPGLLRRGSPVLVGRVSGVVAVDPDGTLGVLLGAWGPPHMRLSDIALDLTDATGRAHATWWLANRLHPDDGPYLAAAVIPGRVLGPLQFGLSTVSVMEGERWRVFDELGTEDLDPLGDDRLLPDGSRWVDAEALRRVVLHVAGLAP